MPVQDSPDRGGLKPAPLRDEGVLIVGSGFFTRNLRAMTFDRGRRALAAGDLDALLDFRHKAPAARLAHRRTERFTPCPSLSARAPAKRSVRIG